MLWLYQATENAVFMGGCGQENRSLACTEQNGPDADIGNSPILTTLPNGQRALLTGTKGGDLFALDPNNNGGRLYRVGAAGADAAPTAIPGVVFSRASNGMLYALSSTDGTVLWEFDTSATFGTVNGVEAHGGGITSTGAGVVDGMVFIGSGYAISSGNSAGNVLLAFGVD